MCKNLQKLAKTCKPDRRQYEWEEKAAEITGKFLT
jgi:hypothetical protein